LLQGQFKYLISNLLACRLVGGYQHFSATCCLPSSWQNVGTYQTKDRSSLTKIHYTHFKYW